MRLFTKLFTKLFVKNFRRGFATNSSSSHSFVYLKEPVANHDDDRIEEEEFQWNDFMLTTRKSKLFYVLCSWLDHYWDSSEAEQTAQERYEELKEEFPGLTLDDFERAAAGYGVDHDSRGLIGLEQANDPHVVVFGGNDNGGRSAYRADTIASKEIDWERTEVEFRDGLPRKYFPFQEEDKVHIDGSDKVWTVSTSKYRPNTIDTYHYFGEPINGKYYERRDDVPVGLVTLIRGTSE